MPIQLHGDRASPSSPPSGMKWIHPGTFSMGSLHFYPEERPVRRVSVDEFWIDIRPVTNRDFVDFVNATGYRTMAEIAPNPQDYPGLLPEYAYPGSLVFQRSRSPISLESPERWWAFVLGADWRHPTGPDSSIEDLMDHPVVHVAYPDAEAYAVWAGKCLPTEAEWEYASRGGLEGAEFAWGDELKPGDEILANYWNGTFPYSNLRSDGYRTTPVGTYPSNGYGLYDMIGNVWEWTADWYVLPEVILAQSGKHPCCTIHDPRGGALPESIDWQEPGKPLGRKVLKGGSHLCAENYCQRYRPAARHPQAIDSASSHIGFRCAWRPHRNGVSS